MATLMANSKIETGTFTVSEDIAGYNYQISNPLGVEPDFVLVQAIDLEVVDTYTVQYALIGFITKKVGEGSNNARVMYTRTTIGSTNLQDQRENRSATLFLNSDWFKVPVYNASTYLKAGVTYHYVIGKYLD